MLEGYRRQAAALAAELKPEEKPAYLRAGGAAHAAHPPFSRFSVALLLPTPLCPSAYRTPRSLRRRPGGEHAGAAEASRRGGPVHRRRRPIRSWRASLAPGAPALVRGPRKSASARCACAPPHAQATPARAGPPGSAGASPPPCCAAAAATPRRSLRAPRRTSSGTGTSRREAPRPSARPRAARGAKFSGGATAARPSLMQPAVRSPSAGRADGRAGGAGRGAEGPRAADAAEPGGERADARLDRGAERAPAAKGGLSPARWTSPLASSPPPQGTVGKNLTRAQKASLRAKEMYDIQRQVCPYGREGAQG